MISPIVYDKAKYHYDGDFPSDLNISHAYIHTGFFLGWLIENNMLDDEFVEEVKQYGNEISQFKEHKITAPKLFEMWDGALDDNMLNDEGNAFTRSYFDFSKGKYLRDYQHLLCRGLPTQYHVEDTWENYEIITDQITNRYRKWKRNSCKKWWQLWR